MVWRISGKGEFLGWNAPINTVVFGGEKWREVECGGEVAHGFPLSGPSRG